MTGLKFKNALIFQFKQLGKLVLLAYNGLDLLIVLGLEYTTRLHLTVYL